VACARGRTYALNGQVLAVDADRKEITIAHQDIVGFMPGMTMPFKVREPRLLEASKPGDLVAATLRVVDAEAYLTAIERTGHRALPESATRPVRPLQPGSVVADAEFSDQSGDHCTLVDWRGRTLAVTFIYTRCPLPDFCPAMNREFAAVQREVLTDPRLRDRVHLLSVTIDPANDTAPVLAEYAKRAGANREVWSFLTGDSRTLDRFAGQFGVSTSRDGSGPEGIVHNLRTAVIGSNGRLVTILSGRDWTAADLLTFLRSGR
jgi:protein SCO1/2